MARLGAATAATLHLPAGVLGATPAPAQAAPEASSVPPTVPPAAGVADRLKMAGDQVDFWRKAALSANGRLRDQLGRLEVAEAVLGIMRAALESYTIRHTSLTALANVIRLMRDDSTVTLRIRAGDFVRLVEILEPPAAVTGDGHPV